MRSFNVVESSTYFWVDTGQALNGKEENAIDSTSNEYRALFGSLGYARARQGNQVLGRLGEARWRAATY